MITDPLLFELWLVALCSIVNRCPPRIHADVAEAVAVRALLSMMQEHAGPLPS